MTHLRRLFLTAGLVALFSIAMWPARADAQWRGHGRGRVYVSFGGYWPYPYWGPYFGFGFGPWGRPYPYGGFYGPYPYPYPYHYGWDPTSSVRLQVTPREAKVFVDGYAAGVVDDFDGTFQRLRVRPGGHEITIYLDGYRTIRQSMYFRPDSGQTIRLAMQPLAPGEVSEPPPPPSKQSPAGEPADQVRPPAGPPPRPEPPPDQPPVEQAPQRFGALVVGVQPADAEIYIDGERWTASTTSGPGAPMRLTIRLTEGRHRLEIKKEGFATFTETILIGRDRTMTLNVSLVRN